MITPPNKREGNSSAGEVFATTHWSVVLAARQPDKVLAEAALEKLCRLYWPPLYAFIRRDGYGVQDAQDLTQEFLSRFIQREWLRHLHDQRGKFRSFLLAFLKHFLADERDRAQALKRGGGQSLVPLDAFEAEERDNLVPGDELTPDEAFDRRWAQAVMSQAAERLREEYAGRGKAALFDQLKELQPNEHGERSYAAIGLTLGLSEQAVKSAVHSFRRRYGHLLREEIAQTVADPAEVQAEIQCLLKIFAG